MAQINQYPVEITDALGANPIQPDDLFDVDKLIDADLGTYESQKVKYGTLLTYFGGAGGTNLGNSDLTQTDQQRTFNGGNKNLLWHLLRRFNIELSEWGDDPNAGLNVNQQGVVGLNRTFVDVQKNGRRSFRVFESGRVEVFPTTVPLVDGQDNGGMFVGDGTIPSAVFGPNANEKESNGGAVLIVASSQKPAIFTDVIIPETPTTFEPQNSALAWFRSVSKGVLFPTMGTIPRDAIITPEKGLVIFNTDTDKLQVYTGIGVSGWSNLN